MAMHHYRVTKYDPARRDLGGSFQGDEWIMRSQIGQVFDGVVFTEAAYLATETAYLAAVAAFLREAGIGRLRLDGLENHNKNPLPDGVGPGALLTPAQAVAFARAALREECWGRLVAPGRAYVHFGRDYYMYVGVPRRCPGAIAEAAARGLFVEAFRSPYLRRRNRSGRTRPAA